jgi:predicted CoA-binding protein
MPMAPLERAHAFLEARRIAFVGVSRDDKDFSRAVLRELVRRGYDVVPVHPEASEIEGRRAFPRVGAVVPPVEAALLMTPPARTDDAVRDCLDAGLGRIWLHRGGGRGSATPEAVARCRAAGVEPVTDLCPFMALPGAAWPHRLHGFLRRMAMRRAPAGAAPASG